MELKVEINLKDLCIITIADSLWNEEDIVNKTKTYLCSSSRYKKKRTWDALTKEIISGINQESLPDFLYTELVYAVDNLGKKRRDFFTYCRMQNIFNDVSREQLYENYLQKVYWTYYGCVDVGRVVRSWFYNPNCDPWKVYVMASCYCSEEFIKEVWMEVKETHKDKPEDFDNLCRDHQGHMAAYWHRYFNNNLEYFIEYVKSRVWVSPYGYNMKESAEKNMFRLAVWKGYNQAAKNMFFKLSEKEKEEDFLEFFNMALRHSHPECDECEIKSKRPDSYFRNDQSLEIFLFLLSCFDDLDLIAIRQFSEYEGEYRLDDYFDFNDIMQFITRWPWVKLIVPFVNETRKYLSEGNYKTLVDRMIAQSHQEHFPASLNNVYQGKFLELWEMLSVDEKGKFSKDVISKLFSLWDVVRLKKILNDKDIYEMRYELIVEGFEKLTTFVEEDNQERIKEFIMLLISGKWEKSTRVNMEMVYQHIMKCEFDLADKILNSFCRSEEEVNSFKNSINSYVMCCYFVMKMELDSADKFLLWKLNSKEWANAFKLNFNYIPFSVRHILKLWDRKVEEAEEAKLQSKNFLAWFLDSEESQKNFIKTKFKNNGELKKFVENSEHGHYEIIDDLLTWCLMSKKEQKSFRTNYLSKKEDLMAKVGYYMREYKWDAAQELLNWKFNYDEDDKSEFLRKFFKSKRWALDCTLFLFNTCSRNVFGAQPSEEEISNIVDEFIKMWMKPVSKAKKKYTRDHLKKFLINWPEVSFAMLKNNETFMRESCSNDEFDADGSDYEMDNEYAYHEDAGHIEIFMEEVSHYYPGADYFFDIDDLNFSDSSDDYCYFGYGRW